MVSYINYTKTQNSITASVAGLTTSSTYTEIYIKIGNQRSANLIRGGSGYSQSLSYTASNLSAGTNYYCEWYLKTKVGSTYSDYIYIMTDSPPAPPTVGDVSYVSVSNSSLGTIGVSWGGAYNATTYRIEVYYGYSGSFITSTESSGNYTTISGLPQGTYLRVKVYGRRYDDGWGWRNGGYSENYIMTTDYSVGGVGTVTVNQLSTSGALNVQWSYATNATSYALEVYDYYNGDRLVFNDYGITYNSYTVYGLNENTYYRVKVYGQGASNGTASNGYGWTKSFAPTQLTGLSAWAGDASGGVHMSWYASTNATGYTWEIYNGTTTTNLVTRGTTTSTSAQYTGLSQYTQYTVKVYATRSGYSNSGYQTAPVKTKDLTPPTVTITTSDGRGRMYISYSASDSMSGIRSSNTYYTEVSNANGSSYSRGSYTTNNYKTFTEDAYGNEFIHDAYYYMKVIAYDADGNNNSTNVRVQYKVARPTDWYWHSNKTAGQAISLTAQEWNSFCTKINLFRQYKSLDNYSFTPATSGGIITASIVNQAVNAISAISPSTSAPSTVVANSTAITASFFNTLSRSLNSIN